MLSSPPKSVLIVDDEAPALANLEWLLARRAQWRLLGACRSNEQARAHLAAAPADLILLDIQMPGQSGLEFARALSQAPDAPLIVFITAYDAHALSALTSLRSTISSSPTTTSASTRCLLLEMPVAQRVTRIPADADWDHINREFRSFKVKYVDSSGFRAPQFT